MATEPPYDEILDCQHPRRTFVRTNEDWFAGDETDIYRCEDCGQQIEEYIPR